MRPSAAEIARTVIAGQVPATLRVACRPGPIAVRHATDCVGRPLLLARVGDPVARALLSPEINRDRPPAVVLHAHDVPPFVDAPSLGRVFVGGTVTPLVGEENRTAVLEYAQTHADPDLFDVGSGAILFQLDVAEVRLVGGPRPEPAGPDRAWAGADRAWAGADRAWAGAANGAGRPGGVVEVDDYLAADPDPLYEQEADLLADLNDHHGAQLRPYLARRLADLADGPTGAPRPVRLDRYGFTVGGTGDGGRPGGGWVRVPFRRPVRDRSDLAELLHPILFGHAPEHHH